MVDSLSLPVLLAIFAIALVLARPFALPRGPRAPGRPDLRPFWQRFASAADPAVKSPVRLRRPYRLEA
jgi:hypothetical protein